MFTSAAAASAAAASFAPIITNKDWVDRGFSARTFPIPEKAEVISCRGCGHELTVRRVDKKGRCEGCGCPSQIAPVNKVPWYMRPEFQDVLKPGAVVQLAADEHGMDAVPYLLCPTPLNPLHYPESL